MDPNEEQSQNNEEPPAKRKCQRPTLSELNAEFQAQMINAKYQRDLYAAKLAAVQQYMAQISMEKSLLYAMTGHVEDMIDQINSATPSLTEDVHNLIEQTEELNVQMHQGRTPITRSTYAKILQLQGELARKETTVQELIQKLEEYSVVIMALQDSFSQDANMEVWLKEEMQSSTLGLQRTIENMTCSICIQKCTLVGEHVVVSLPCGHLFGEKCIVATLNLSPQCPICNTPCTINDVKRLYSNINQ